MKEAERKKYLKFKISNLLKRYMIASIKKNLKNIIDFINLNKSLYSYSCKYNDRKRLKPVEKKIARKNKKIIFIGRLNSVVKIFDLKWKIPKQQNIIRLIFVIKFPKIKLIGKKEKTRLVNKIELTLKIFLFKVIIKPHELF